METELNEIVDSINATKQLINEIEPDKQMDYPKSWIRQDTVWAVNNIQAYNIFLEYIYSVSKIFNTRFSRKTIFPELEKVILNSRIINKDFNIDDVKILLNTFENISKQLFSVLAPISGIRLDNPNSDFVISIFEFGNSSNLQLPLSNSAEVYIKVDIDGLYDVELAVVKAQNAFDDFARLIYFFAGKNDGTIIIKTGLPSYPIMSHEQMYVETTSYQINSNNNQFDKALINNRLCQRVPLDNNFFCENKDFKKLWYLYKQRHINHAQTDIEKRILNASLAVGESLKSGNIKNSIIYTCIALEILLSFDEGSIFQKSIADRLAETFVFLVAKDKETRLSTERLVKNVYKMRSALVHGGDKAINDEYITINVLLRAAISELLNNEKYKKMKKIDELYKMVKEAHYSY